MRLTAGWQCSLSNARIVVMTLLMAAGGCASTGPNAPATNQETAAGAMVGVAGAAGGAVGGVAIGALSGIRCGFLAIVCSPVMAVVGGVKGATAGGEAGARTGVRWSRSDSSPESAKSPSEPSAPESSGQPVVTQPVLTSGSGNSQN